MVTEETYSTVEEIESHVPIVFTDTSKPSLPDINFWRVEVYGMINAYLGGAQGNPTGLKRLEIRKVLQMLDNYYARGKGEKTIPVTITDNDFTLINVNQFSGGGGHYSVEVP